MPLYLAGDVTPPAAGRLSALAFSLGTNGEAEKVGGASPTPFAARVDSEAEAASPFVLGQALQSQNLQLNASERDIEHPRTYCRTTPRKML